MSAATFEEVVLPQAENLYGAAMRLAKDPVEADELVQDTMVRAFRFWDTFEQGTNVKAWLFTILRNTHVNNYHRRERQRRRTAEVASSVASCGSRAAVAMSEAEPADCDRVLDATMVRDRIHSALRKLPAHYRNAVILADLEGLSYKEISETMGCPIGTAMSRIHRGRKHLHAELREHAVDLGIVEAAR